jgi:small subunit ribosomal protein S10
MAKNKQTWKIRIIIRSFDHKLINRAAEKIIDATERSWAIIAWPIPMPTKIKKITINRSTFVNKDAREQFEIRTHKRLIDINESTPQTIETLKNLSLPSWVDIEIKMSM